ncbi:MAG: hypothetical protein R3C52_15965 [Hyphomonadaceae bacterium]
MEKRIVRSTLTRAVMAAFTAVLLALLPGALPASADETTATCPDDAEQTLYAMVSAINTGAQTDPAPVVELAEWAVAACPGRTDVQSIAAVLVGVALATTNDLATVDRYITLALTAISQNDHAWNPKHKPSVLKRPDGTEFKYFGYNEATGVLTGKVLPYVVALAEAGRVHPIISGAPLAACPYADHSSGRLDSEAKLWDTRAQRRYDQPIFTWAAARLTALRNACPSHARDLDFALARLYGQEVERLTRWNHEYLENINFGRGGWFWSNPSIPDTITDKSAMEAKKAELDAIARPLAKSARPYLDAFLDIPPEKMQSDRDRVDEAIRWRKAIETLEQTPG